MLLIPLLVILISVIFGFLLADVEANPNPNPNPNPDLNPDPNSDPNPNPDLDPNPNPNPDLDPNPNPNQGWSHSDGFYYVVGNLVGLATPLTEITPVEDKGKLVDIVIAVWSLSLAGTAIGVIGSLSLVSRLSTMLETGAEEKEFSLMDTQALMKFVDDHDSLTFGQFAIVMDSLGWYGSGSTTGMEDLHYLFNTFDGDGDGSLDKTEVEAIAICLVRTKGDLHGGKASSVLVQEAKLHAEAWRIKEQNRKMANDIFFMKAEIGTLRTAVANIERYVTGAVTDTDYDALNSQRQEHDDEILDAKSMPNVTIEDSESSSPSASMSNLYPAMRRSGTPTVTTKRGGCLTFAS